MGWKRLDWFDLAQDRNEWRPVVNSVIKFNVDKCAFWAIAQREAVITY
jgi:hypothetical protein